VNPFDSLSDALPMVDTMVHSEDKLQTSMTITDENIIKGNPHGSIRLVSGCTPGGGYDGTFGG
jgi:hypothetical protein